MGTTYKIHKFQKYPDRGQDTKRSCIKCGRMRNHWLHTTWDAVQKYLNKENNVSS